MPDDALIYVSAITLGEIACGHYSDGSTDARKRREFLQWIDETFDSDELVISRSTMDPYGLLRAELFRRFGGHGKHPEQCVDASGHSLGIDENDLWLAAQAIEHNLTLITADKMCRITEVGQGELDVQTWPLV